MNVSGIVLAGGASRRMGRDKAWVELGGKYLIVRVLDALRQVCDDVVVVANERTRFEPLGARVVGDEFAETGSLGGVYTGLHAADNELAIAVACDMPFLNPDVLRFLISVSSESDVIIPSVPDERKAKDKAGRPDTAKRRDLHPLHAVYRKTCLESMRDAIARNDLRMIAFHDAVRVRVVEQAEFRDLDPQYSSFWNVNTPQELERAERVITERPLGV